MIKIKSEKCYRTFCENEAFYTLKTITSFYQRKLCKLCYNNLPNNSNCTFSKKDYIKIKV